MVELPEWIGDFFGWVREHLVDFILLAIVVGVVGGLGYVLFSSFTPDPDHSWEITTQAGEVLVFDECSMNTAGVRCWNDDGKSVYIYTPIMAVEVEN